MSELNISAISGFIDAEDNQGLDTPDYKNWMPRWVCSFLDIGIGTFAIAQICLTLFGKNMDPKRKAAVRAFLNLAQILCGAGRLWTYYIRSKFSYSGKRKLSQQIVEGVAEYIDIPEGGIGLDVGCGSGALTIACAKRNPGAKIIGIDRWGMDYPSYSKRLCESNAKAEGVSNTEFRDGNAISIDYPDEIFDAVTSNYVYHNITGADKRELLRETLRVLKKGGCFAIHDTMTESRFGDMKAFAAELISNGYSEVELIRTDDGMFMTKGEAVLTALSGSTLFVGKK